MTEHASWTLLSFPALVLAIAALPIVVPRLWQKLRFQGLVVIGLTLPGALHSLRSGAGPHVGQALVNYAAFIATIGALYITAGGIHVKLAVRPTPATNTGLLVVGAMLASVIGTTGASMLLIRPLLRINRGRGRMVYLVPFFILMVSNAGGLLTPLGDPPLLVGHLLGVPFFWTLRLWPIWLLYVASFAVAFFVFERRSHRAAPLEPARDSAGGLARVSVTGRFNVVLLLSIAPAIFLPRGWREAAMTLSALLSYFTTPREIHQENRFDLRPLLEVAIIFGGLFTSLTPFELWLAERAHALPIRQAWQIFWASGLLSSVLDNAPTYSAFAALTRGLGGQGSLVAGMDPLKLAALSAGCVVMGATTYIGNGPNLMVKAIAEREGLAVPSFARYALFVSAIMLPANLILTGALMVLER